MASIIEQINSFTQNNKELVILDFTHGLNTDNWTDKNSALTQQEWERLLNLLGGLKNRITGLGSIAHLTTLKLSQLINNRAAVIIVVDAKIQGGGRVDISRFVSQGLFTRKQFPLYNVVLGHQ